MKSIYYYHNQINYIANLGVKRTNRQCLYLNELINELYENGYSVRIDKVNKEYIIERCING